MLVGALVVDIDPHGLEPVLGFFVVLELELADPDQDGGRSGICKDRHEFYKFSDVFFGFFDGGIDRIDRYFVGVVGVPDRAISDVRDIKCHYLL